jgi:hypothetical protein
MPPLLHSEHPQLLNLESDADPDPYFHSKADPDLAPQNDEDPCIAVFVTLANTITVMGQEKKQLKAEKDR